MIHMSNYGLVSRQYLDHGTLNAQSSTEKSNKSLVSLVQASNPRFTSITKTIQLTLFLLAANVQCMVFGNLGNSSGTGVAFSRNPGSGVNEMMGEYLINAQGEDVVAGIRTPQPISKMKEVLPKAYEKFIENINLLERHFGDMQDVEFTVENGKLWMLQCRSGKRKFPFRSINNQASS